MWKLPVCEFLVSLDGLFEGAVIKLLMIQTHYLLLMSGAHSLRFMRMFNSGDSWIPWLCLFLYFIRTLKHCFSLKNYAGCAYFSHIFAVFSPPLQIVYAAVDCTKGQNHDLCKQEGVEGYPTFNYYNYGKFVEKYSGDRGVSTKTYLLEC